jgi:hypothetical protein
MVLLSMKRHPLFIMLGCLGVVLLLSLSLGQQTINPFNPPLVNRPSIPLTLTRYS